MAQQNGNIDQRLDRLVERHEALTQTVEHLGLQGEEQNKKLDRIFASLDRITGSQDRITGSIEKMLAVIESDSQNIRALARIAEAHERRISGLESGGTEQGG